MFVKVLAVVPKLSIVDCFCNNTLLSALVSQNSISLVPAGGGGGGAGSPFVFFLHTPKRNSAPIAESMNIIFFVCINKF
jgi:hypothetical protein